MLSIRKAAIPKHTNTEGYTDALTHLLRNKVRF